MLKCETFISRQTCLARVQIRAADLNSTPSSMNLISPDSWCKWFFRNFIFKTRRSELSLKHKNVPKLQGYESKLALLVANELIQTRHLRHVC